MAGQLRPFDGEGEDEGQRRGVPQARAERGRAHPGVAERDIQENVDDDIDRLDGRALERNPLDLPPVGVTNQVGPGNRRRQDDG